MCGFLPVLVFASCRNKTPQIGWFKKQKFIFSQFWSLAVHDRDVRKFNLFLTRRYPPSDCFLHWPLLCALAGGKEKEIEGEVGPEGRRCTVVSLSFPIRAPELTFNYLGKGSVWGGYINTGGYNFNTNLWRKIIQMVTSPKVIIVPLMKFHV